MGRRGAICYLAPKYRSYALCQQLMRMRSYCTQEQLSLLFKTLVWSALESVNVLCTCQRPPPLQNRDFLAEHRLHAGSEPLSSTSVRRKIVHAAMIHKQMLHQPLTTSTNYSRSNSWSSRLPAENSNRTPPSSAENPKKPQIHQDIWTILRPFLLFQ